MPPRQSISRYRLLACAPKGPLTLPSPHPCTQAYDVVIVDPRCDPRAADVAKTSVLSPLIHRMRVVPTLADALADCTGGCWPQPC